MTAEDAHLGGSDRTDDAPREVEAATRHVFRRLSPILLLFGGLTVAVTIRRAFEFGWQPLIILYAAFFLGIIAVVQWQRRMPVGLVIGLLSGIGIIDGIISALHFGLASASIILLLVSVVLIGVFVGTRAALLTCGFVTLALTFVAVLVTTQIWHIDVELNEYAVSPIGWTVQIVHFVFLASLLSALVSAIQEALKASIVRLEQRTGELAATNRSLQEEVAARGRVEDELRQREARYRMLTDRLREVLLQLDLDGRVVYVSPSVEQVMGYSLAEATQLTAKEVLTPESYQKAMDQLRLLLQGERDPHGNPPFLELEHVRKDGTTFWGECAADRLSDETGKPIGAVVVIRDITERRRAQREQERMTERIRKAEKLQTLGRLAGGVAHDFNNQLAGILGCAELIKVQCADNEPVCEAIQVILRCGQRSRELTTKLLALARRDPERTLVVDMHDIIREVEAIVGRSVGNRVAIGLRLEAPRARVMGDPSQLQNALLNLAVNARDAMPDGGTLTFCSSIVRGTDAQHAEAAQLDEDKDYLLIEVRDTGVGISAEDLPHIFEPFFTTKEPGQGTGIGLPAVQGTALAHQGAIHVRSQFGEGSTFGLYLPLTTEPERPAIENHSKWTSGSGRILVVDDEPNMRSVLQLSLGDLGYSVDVSRDGAEAVGQFTANPTYDLVLLDMVMPGMNGKAVFHALRAVAPEAKIILMSGYSEDDDTWSLLQAGALKLIPKPFMLSELSAEVAKALRTEDRAN